MKCPNYPSFENSTTVELTVMQSYWNLILNRYLFVFIYCNEKLLWILQDVMENAYSSNYKYESRAKMPIEVSGIVTCKACNSLGCDSVTENIFVSGEEIHAFV